jgi:hemerythrin-like domain-containing protein
MNLVIHAAFRRDLRRFDDALKTFPEGSSERARQLLSAWDHYSYQLHRHHEDEETLFWPAYVELGAEQTLMTDLDAEHKRMVEALDAAEVAMRAFGANPGKEETANAQQALDAFERALTDHLTHEERDLEPFVQPFESTPQIKTAVSKAKKSHSEGAGAFFAWLVDDCTPDTAKAMRSEVPPPVLFVLTRLGARKYDRAIASAWS